MMPYQEVIFAVQPFANYPSSIESLSYDIRAVQRCLVLFKHL